MEDITKTKNIQDVLAPARMTRKSFLKLSATTLAVGAFGGLATGCTKPRGRNLKLANLEEVLAELDLIEANPPIEMQQEWTLYKVLNHVAQSAEYSMTGYPQLDPPFEQSVKRVAFNYFKSQGYMIHDLGMPVPGAPDIPDSGDLPLAFERVRNAISDFQNFTGALHPHFSYGDLNYDDWEIAHSMHMGDHFSSLSYEVAGD